MNTQDYLKTLPLVQRRAFRDSLDQIDRAFGVFTPRPALRAVPEPEAVPARTVHYCGGGAAVAALCHRADRIIARVYGKPGSTPHGFYEPLGFVASCRDRDARNRLRKLVLDQLIVRSIGRGQLYIVKRLPDGRVQVAG